jgi:type II restriction enzyme
MDVLNCVNSIPTDDFTLQDMYRFVDELSVKHTGNRNVEAKIRQQLQLLRDKGFIEFLGRGHYRKKAV